MTERPIIMSGESVRAILVGQKTQTRRVVKLRPRDGMCATDCSGVEPEKAWADPGLGGGGYLKVPCRDGAAQRIHCPYGVPGDRLWVKEVWGAHPWLDEYPPRAITRGEPIAYRVEVDPRHDPGLKWRSPIHMPRWASCLTLELTDVRVQRLHDISEEDARAEGMKPCNCDTAGVPEGWCRGGSFVHAYAGEWTRINGKRIAPWGAINGNVWVWALTFRRLA